MKKLLLGALLLLSMSMFSQEPFVRKYTSIIVTKDDVSEEEKEAELTAVFNPNGQRGVKFYYGSGEVTEYYQVSDLKEGVTSGGYKYQIIDILEKKEGVHITLQLFDDDGVLRLIFSAGNTIEFYE
jgi:hypothetical protein